MPVLIEQWSEKVGKCPIGPYYWKSHQMDKSPPPQRDGLLSWVPVSSHRLWSNC